MPVDIAACQPGDARRERALLEALTEAEHLALNLGPCWIQFYILVIRNPKKDSK